MPDQPGRSRRPPLDAARLDELALAYVGRFATTRAKLRNYLQRKLRERGWEGSEPPDVAAIADRCAGLGYVDDRAFAVARSRSLSARGFGPRRIGQALTAAGIDAEDRQPATALAAEQAVDAAIRFAERRRIGPFAAAAPDPRTRERALSAMVRAGHQFALARAIVDLRPGASANLGELRHLIGLESN